MNPIVSIIIPVYNVENYLQDCLNSVLHQTLKELEVILVDDGSTDSSGDICDRYQSIDSRVRVYHLENGGVSNARNYGLNRAAGQFVIFVDSDDWIESDMCDSMLSAIKQYNSDMCICDNYNESSSGSKCRFLFDNDRCFVNEDFRTELLIPTLGLIGVKMRNPARLDRLTPIWARMYKRKIIIDNNVKFIDLNTLPSECLQFNFDYLLCCNSAVYTKKALYHYRRNSNDSVTKPYRENLLDKWRWWDEHMLCLLHKYDKDNELLGAFYSRICCSVIPLGGNAMKLKKFNLIREETKRFLTADFIMEAYKNLDVQYCPFYWKIFFWSAKKRCVVIFIFMTYCMRKILGLRKN